MRGKLQDHTGKRFGRLIVVSRVGDKSPVRWLCLCDCGKQTVALSQSLVTGMHKSCGCLRVDVNRTLIKPMPCGKKFGRLTIIGIAPNKVKNEVRSYFCRCDCGTLRTVRGSTLRSGRTKSCGCDHSNRTGRAPKNLIGKTFQLLTVISRVGKTSPARWNCQCRCGNEVVIRDPRLLKGVVSSCGCLAPKRMFRTPNPSMNLLGGKYGKLTVISLAPREDVRHPHIRWICQCECGNTTCVRTDALLGRGQKPQNSCGCERVKRRLSVGDKSGAWTVLSVPPGGRHTRGGYYCKCVCGTERCVNTKSLLIGESKSCGCLMGVYSKTPTLPHHRRYSDIWTPKMERELKSFQPACVLCGKMTKLTTDHVLPASLGYGFFVGNAIRLCQPCNSSKRNKLPTQLDVGRRFRIQIAAAAFEDHWNSQHAPT